MPGLDKTGPLGEGSQTGRNQGNCSDNNTANSDRPLGLGRRMGRGFRNRRNPELESGSGLRGGKGRGRGLGRSQRRGQNA